MILSNRHSHRKTIQSSSAAANANRKPFLMKKESSIDHRLHVVKNEANRRTYRSGSHNQLTLKTSADCISKHVAAKIQQNILKVNCPNPMCNVKLKGKYLQPILPKEVIDRWELAKLESSIDLSQKFYCPFKDCSVLLVNDGDGRNVVISSECPYCHRLFCAQCKVPWHAKMSCKEFRRLKRSEGEKDLDRKFLELAKRKMWQKCPKCSFYVQRHNGYEHMTCRCGRNFCYKCGKDWRHGHLCNSHQST